MSFPRSLLSIADLGADGIAEVLELASSFEEVSARRIPRVPALRGKTVVGAFFEDSTRTRLSFELAAKRLSADTLTFSAGSSSLNKGESLRDTVETIDAMGVDALVVRHRSSGAPVQIAGWVGAHVINAGDGWHEHPTQALLDCFTLCRHFGRRTLDGMSVAIVGDVAHSRVARSNVWAMSALGAEVTLVAPPTLLPSSLAGWPVSVAYDLDAVLPSTDVVYLLRIQAERIEDRFLPPMREYVVRYGLDRERMARLDARAVVLHPGPMNRGVEIAAEVADDPACLVREQVRAGVAVRMAVLFLLLGAEPGTSDGAAESPPVLGEVPAASRGGEVSPLVESGRPNGRAGATGLVEAVGQ